MSFGSRRFYPCHPCNPWSMSGSPKPWTADYADNADSRPRSSKPIRAIREIRGPGSIQPFSPWRTMLTAIAASSIEMIFEMARMPVPPITRPSFSLK